MSMMLTTMIGMALLVWFWSDSLKAREYALKRCQRSCESIGAQLLDQTIGLRRLGLKRGRDGRVHLMRGYFFEFSLNGADRHQGIAVLAGHAVEYLRLEHPEGPLIVTDEPSA